MTSRNRIGLAASLVLGTLTLAAVAAPASSSRRAGLSSACTVEGSIHMVIPLAASSSA